MTDIEMFEVLKNYVGIPNIKCVRESMCEEIIKMLDKETGNEFKCSNNS
jgi:hypothetical protein